MGRDGLLSFSTNIYNSSFKMYPRASEMISLFRESTFSCYLVLHKSHEYFKILLTYGHKRNNQQFIYQISILIQNGNNHIVKSEPFSIWSRIKWSSFIPLFFKWAQEVWKRNGIWLAYVHRIDSEREPRFYLMFLFKKNSAYTSDSLSVINLKNSRRIWKKIKMSS